jgi:hypothetical protein
MKLLVSLLVIISFNAFATKLIVRERCSKEIQFEVEFESLSSVGAITKILFEEYHIPHLGTSQGMNSIFHSPTGSDAVDVIGRNHMRAYGWCYKVDGFEPSEYPDKYPVSKETKEILWFFGYATYKDGQWITQCKPAYNTPNSSVCKN